MTFDEYNTDEYFNNNNSSADGLVKTAFEEGKTREEVENSLSPLWKEDKKGNVKKALDTYYKKEEPKEEKPADEFKEEEVISKPSSTLSNSEKKYINKQNEIADTAKKEMLEDIKNDSKGNWEENYNSMLKRADAYKNIDDHYFEGLPTFIFRRYQNGEFGDTGSTDAKLRMAYFMINGLGTSLSNASNVIKGRALEESDYQKFQNSQMANALQNRWEKNKADTEGAIKAVEKEFGNEQDARLAAEQFTRDQKAATKWNMMSQAQKVYALQVTKEIGDMLGGMNTSELANFIAGSALVGDVNKEEIIAIGIAKLAANSPNILANLPDGNIKNMVMGMIGGNAQDVVAGVGGAGGNITEGEDKPSRNLKNYKTINGDTVDFDMIFTKGNGGKEKLEQLTKELSEKYYNGDIDEKTFREYFTPLYEEGKKHASIKVFSPDDVIRDNNTRHLNELNTSFDELNNKAKSGVISTSDYDEQYSDLITNAKKWGADNKLLKSLNKNKMTSQQILKYVDKANKKKK